MEFFTRSKVPVPILKEIWKVSDQPGTNSLDPRKFAVAVRLIQLEQNGLKPTGPDLAVGVPPNLRPVFFEGIPIPGPPPQQQQQQPLPPQQHQRPPVSMAAGSVGGGASISGSVTGNGNYPHYQQQQLIVQDPYAMSPAEQSRYEQIFPEYCSKQDPYYVYGAEAVALFSKSGLEQAQLALIWSMVDTPTDNRLDKIEFAIAMHLIVCVSKKNLPVPPALPMSLVQLKAQPQTAAMSTNAAPIMNGSGNPASPPRIIQQQQPAVNNPPPPPIQAHMNIGGGPMAASGGGGVPWSTTSSAAPRDMQFQMAQGGGMPSPSMAAANPRDMQHQMAQGGGVSNFPSAAGNPRDMQFQMAQRGGMQSSPRATAAHASVVPPPLPISGVQGPPPLSQQGLGGVSISDAFEGLIGGGDTGSISSYRASTPVPAASSFQMAATASYNHSAYESIPPQDQSPPHVSTIYQPAPEAMRSAATSTQLASSYDMGEANEELEKLRGALQKLQAENISLKAKMGTMTDEEHDVQKELNATVAEVTKLATNLTNVRAQVLASKSRLLEASAELKATKERKGYVVTCVQLGLRLLCNFVKY